MVRGEPTKKEIKKKRYSTFTLKEKVNRRINTRYIQMQTKRI